MLENVVRHKLGWERESICNHRYRVALGLFDFWTLLTHFGAFGGKNSKLPWRRGSVVNADYEPWGFGSIPGLAQ